MPIGHLSGRFHSATTPLPQSQLCLGDLEVIPRSKYQKGALVLRSFLLCPLIDSLCPHQQGNGISGGPKTDQGHMVSRGRARRALSTLEPSKLLSPGQVLQNPLNYRERERELQGGLPCGWLWQLWRGAYGLACSLVLTGRRLSQSGRVSPKPCWEPPAVVSALSGGPGSGHASLLGHRRWLGVKAWL